MKENLLMKINNFNQVKKWRNISIFLLFLFLICFLSLFYNKKNININSDIIAEIKIDGIIVNDDYRNKKIEEITKDNKIKAVILTVDSPGGQVTPSENLYNLLYELNKKKPLVIIMDSMATSGGYMISLASDYLIAKNTTITGSIGVLLESFEFVDLSKKIGINIKTFKSSELKGMPSPFEKNTPNSNKVTEEMVNDVYDYFTSLVKHRRPKLTKENFKKSINGQAFTGRQAIKIGLVDEIGNKNSALKYLESKKINTKLPLVKIDLEENNKLKLFKKLNNIIFNNYESKSNYNNLMLIYK